MLLPPFNKKEEQQPKQLIISIREKEKYLSDCRTEESDDSEIEDDFDECSVSDIDSEMISNSDAYSDGQTDAYSDDQTDNDIETSDDSESDLWRLIEDSGHYLRLQADNMVCPLTRWRRHHEFRRVVHQQIPI